MNLGETMLNISGWIGETSKWSYVNNDVALLVSSAGHYKLLTMPKYTTYRENGRTDYQLLYVASGTATFVFDGEEHRCPAGSVVLYRPNETHFYSYNLKDKTEMYWIHFTGNKVEDILGKYGPNKQISFARVSNKYVELCEKIIYELQLKRPMFGEITAALFLELLGLISRGVQTRKDAYDASIEEALIYFHKHYNENIELEQYAKSCNMSICWFARQFRNRTGMSPKQYITDIRIGNAKTLLHATNKSIGEIGYMCGYDNQLYFSRIFKKYVGISPRDYREQKH